MKTILVILIALVVFFVVIKGASVVSSSPQCPPGYVPSSTPSTWAGWSFECVPRGRGDALVPSRTLTRPLTTIYTPIVAGTRFGSESCGEPAGLDEFGGRPTVYSRV